MIKKLSSKPNKIFPTVLKGFDWLGEKIRSKGTRRALFRMWLQSKLKKALKNSLIKLIVSILAVYLAISMPFGNPISLWVSSFLFIGIILWSFIDFISFLVEFYELPIMIVQECSISNGMSEFIKVKYPKVTGGYEIFRVVGPIFSPKCKGLPSINEMVQDLVTYFAKEAIQLVVFFSAYISVVYYFLKPLILVKCTGLTTMQIYLFPITQISQEFG